MTASVAKDTGLPEPASQDIRVTKRRRRGAWAIFLLLAHSLGFVSSLHALMATRTPQGAIAWITALNTFPYVAVPAYWVFGRTKFQGYVIARRDLDSALAASLADKKAAIGTQKVSGPRESRDVRALEALARTPFVDGNALELLIDGEATFGSMFQGIDAARRYVLVQTYILRDDEIGRALQRRLIERAQAGLEVHLLYDEIGSYTLPASHVRALTDAGVRVNRFHSTRGFGNRFQLNFRNHRKVMVVDGEQGWLGGFNFGNEYMGREEDGGPWRDTHLRIEGPAVLNLQLAFVEDWHWATDEVLELPWTPPVPADEQVPVLILPSGPSDRVETASLMMQQLIHGARQRIWLSSPYFVPDEGVLAALKVAALAGVDVRVLIPEESDNPLVHMAAYAFIGPLLDAGVSLHRYQAGFLHGKAGLVDDDIAWVTSVNLDNRSFRLNFEMTAIAIDQAFASQMERMLLEDMRRSRVMEAEGINDKPLWFRIASRAAYLFAPVL
jgi:cardiolipin synthase A/B